MYLVFTLGTRCNSHLVSGMPKQQSAICMEVNGIFPSGNRTRHMNLIDLFMKNRVNYGVVEVKHFSAENMIDNYPTNRIEGFLFQILWEMIMNIVLQWVVMGTGSSVKMEGVLHDTKVYCTVIEQQNITVYYDN